MTYRVVATEIIDDTDRVVFNALDNKLIRRKLCQEMNRAESAESRAAQLETDNDEMQSYINEIRVALHTEKDELTIEAVRRVISERDELARKLEQAQHALSLADVGNFDALCDWISGAQSELHQARLTIDNLTSPRDDFPYEGDEMEALQREATA